MSKARYILDKSEKSGEFYFHLKAKNGKIILQSEMYKTKQGARNGLKSVQTNASSTLIVDKTKTKK